MNEINADTNFSETHDPKGATKDDEFDSDSIDRYSGDNAECPATNTLYKRGYTFRHRGGFNSGVMRRERG